MKSKVAKSNETKLKKNINKDSNKYNEKFKLKEILTPMVLEVIGKDYTDAYFKDLGIKYYDLIENLIQNNNMGNINKGNNYNSTYWKDYDFIKNNLGWNNEPIREIINNKTNKEEEQISETDTIKRKTD